MATFRHRNGRTLTANPGSKRYGILSGSAYWSEVVTAKASAPAAPPVPEPVPVVEEPPATGHLESLPVKQLRSIAADLGLTGYSKLNKDDLIAAIRAG